MNKEIQFTTEQLAALNTGRVAIPTDDSLFRVEGPAAVACVQGIFTNDIDKVSVPSLRFGAVLTPKGLIISPMWVMRDNDGVTLIVPRAGADQVRSLLAKSFPPRLAKVSDQSEGGSVWWLNGGEPPSVDKVVVVQPDGPAPMSQMMIGDYHSISEVLAETDWQIEDQRTLRLAQLLGGWPTLGNEIDEKTLVQEVRFDELEAVKYDKGCYVGQETVSRLHFRGHANKTLRAIHGRGEPPTDPAIKSGEKVVGQIATLASVNGQWIASAKIRREVATGDTVDVGGISSVVGDFPFDAGSATA